jgi:hypothetical protein
MKTPQAHTQFFRDNGLTIVLMAIFALTLVGMAWTGWRVADEEFVSHGRAALTLGQYLASGEFVSALFENWESEFLQMACYVMLTAALFQRGSAESRDPDGDETEPTLSPKSPWAARQGGWIRALYELSLGLALTLLFLVSFGLHWWGSFRAANDDAISHGEPPPEDGVGIRARCAILVRIVPELAVRIPVDGRHRGALDHAQAARFAGIETGERAAFGNRGLIPISTFGHCGLAREGARRQPSSGPAL